MASVVRVCSHRRAVWLQSFHALGGKTELNRAEHIFLEDVLPLQCTVKFLRSQRIPLFHYLLQSHLYRPCLFIQRDINDVTLVECSFLPQDFFFLFHFFLYISLYYKTAHPSGFNNHLCHSARASSLVLYRNWFIMSICGFTLQPK